MHRAFIADEEAVLPPDCRARGGHHTHARATGEGERNGYTKYNTFVRDIRASCCISSRPAILTLPFLLNACNFSIADDGTPDTLTLLPFSSRNARYDFTSGSDLLLAPLHRPIDNEAATTVQVPRCTFVTVFIHRASLSREKDPESFDREAAEKI